MLATATAPPIDTQTDTTYLPPPQGEWTYADYLRFVPDEPLYRYEVVEGHVYMNAAPLPIHQKIIVDLSFEIKLLIHTQKLAGELYVAPIDLLLEGVATPVQPDLLFIHADRLEIVGKKNIDGAPDLIVEVLSSNWQHDRKIKFDAYRNAGVKEYWIVDPQDKQVEVYVLRGEAYICIGRFTNTDAIKSEQIPAFSTTVQTIMP